MNHKLRRHAEKKFLIRYAVDKYNSQHNVNIKYEDIEIVSISPNENTDLGYELTTINQKDNLRLRMYLIYENKCELEDYRLEVDNTFARNKMGDEVFVTIGTMDLAFKESDLYSFQWLTSDDNIPYNAILTEDGNPLLTEDGLFIIQEI